MNALSFIFTILFLFFVIQRSNGKVIMCYYSSWATYRWSYGKFDVESIDPFLCTHLMYGFAGLDPQTLTIKSLDPYNDLADNYGRGAFNRFTNLKKINPNLKTILSIGGWNEGATTYSKMVASPLTRKRFIKSVVILLQAHNFDGLDFDWEYPGGRQDSPGSQNDKENLGIFLKEIRREFNVHKFLLTAAVSSGKTQIDASYNVPVLSQTLDYINVMTYDYHGWWKNHHYTGINSPLYGRPEESNSNSPGLYMNTNYSMKYWESLGARKDQLLVGLAAYGRGFILADSAKHNIYDAAINGIDPGTYGGERGIWGFNEICETIIHSSVHNWNFVRDPYALAPYIHKGTKWLSYDDTESISIKAQYVLDNDYAGAFLWSIDTDDFHGFCSEGKFPILNRVKSVFNGETQFTSSAPSFTSTPKITSSISSTLQTSTLSSTNDEFCSDGTLGIKPHPHSCNQFIICAPGHNGSFVHVVFTCTSGLYFNAEIGNCDWVTDSSNCEIV